MGMASDVTLPVVHLFGVMLNIAQNDCYPGKAVRLPPCLYDGATHAARRPCEHAYVKAWQGTYSRLGDAWPGMPWTGLAVRKMHAFALITHVIDQFGASVLI